MVEDLLEVHPESGAGAGRGIGRVDDGKLLPLAGRGIGRVDDGKLLPLAGLFGYGCSLES